MRKTTTNKAKIIKVKNAEGDLDTQAEVVIQNQIDYTPKVSVIIPVYNVEEYLKKCLDSVVNQTLKEIEIICIDDGSTDNSLKILKQYAKKDKRITVIKQKNLHAGVARNAGLAVAKGEYVHFLDSDDWIDADTYDKLYKIAKKHKCSFVKFKSYSYDEQTHQVVSSYFTDINYMQENTFVSIDEDAQTALRMSDAPWSGIYKLSFLNDNNIRFDNFICANDTGFYYRCLLKSRKFYFVTDRFVYYRINNNKSLIGIRPLNFDCQIKLHKRILQIAKDETLFLKNLLDAHFCHAILWRYKNYMADKHLSKSVKNNIKKLTAEFFSGDVNIEYKKAYFSYLIEKKDFNMFMRAYLFFPYYWLKLKMMKYKQQNINTPKVSIIIPIYNTERYLADCLNSIIKQTLKDIEIICINDCSKDNSLDVLKKFAKKDKRIVIINNKKNTGAPGAVRNIGLKYAKGQYIGFIDSDDYVDQNYFKKLYLEAVKNDADIACSLELVHIYPDQRISKRLNCREGTLITPEEKSALMQVSGSVWNKIYRKSFLQNNNVSCYQIKHFSEDNYFSMIAMSIANKIVTCTKTGFYYYRHHENSITSEISTNKDFIIFDTYKSIDREIKKYFKDKDLRIRYLNAVNRRKIQNFKWFIQDCDPTFLSEFRFKLKEEFPNIYSKATGGDIIVSLTSYPARINTVNQTIETLLNQSFKADKVILWLAPEQFPNKEDDLPQQLLDLKEKGLTIDWYHDIKSYKKLIPTLKKYPDAIIVTADDDALYAENWLEKLYRSFVKYPKDIQAHRVTKFYYSQMFQTISGGKDYYHDASYLNKLVGLGGVLYPPHCFYKDILDETLFLKLAPTNDDQWFWLQAALNNVKVRVVDNPIIEANYVQGTQETGLTRINDHGRNLFWKDFNRIIKYYPQLKVKLMNEVKRYRLSSQISVPYKTELLHWWYQLKKTHLNLDNPKTFNEKIQWLKLYDSTPIKTRLADKYLVRDWVKEKIGEEYLIPLLGVYDKFDDIDFAKLPKQFVIKCNHGCGYNIIVKDKSKLDLSDAKAKIDKWMNENFAFRVGFELHYRDIEPKIIIEKYIENKGTDDLYDYKFWCFNGKVEYIQFLSERNLDGLKMAFYDKNWHKQKFVYSYPLDKKTIKKPDNLDVMIELAKKLSVGFNHVRVDFYRLNDGTIYFGEMTFTSASGTCKWNDERINRYFGNLIKLPKLAYNIDTGEYYKLPKKNMFKAYMLFPYYWLKLQSLKKQYYR